MKGTGLFMKELISKDVKGLVAMRKQLKQELFYNLRLMHNDNYR